MQSRSARSKVFRAVGVLAALLLAAGVISPAFGASEDGLSGKEKKKVKKISKNQATNQINALVPGLVTSGLNSGLPAAGNPLFIQETELDRIGPVNINIGGASQTLGTWGPFSLLAECVDGDATADTDIEANVFVRTTQANSVFASLWDSGVFSPGDNAELWAQNTPADPDNDPGDPAIPASYDETSYAAAPTGPVIWGVVSATVNLGTNHCSFSGFTLSIA